MKVFTIAELRPALLLSAVLLIGAGAGYAQNYSGTWHIVSKIGPALCVGENDRNNSDPIVILNNYSAAATHTQWVLELKDDGSYIITNVKTQNVIDVPYSNKDNSVPLIQYSRHGGANQRWRVQTDRDGYVSFVSVASEKLIEIPNGVRVDNTQVIQYAYNNGDSQKFILVPVGAAVCPTCGVPSAQSDAKEAEGAPVAAVYVTGDAPDYMKKFFGARLLSALVSAGAGVSGDSSAAFLAAAEGERSKRGGALDDGMIRELAGRFGVMYVCVASITPVPGAYTLSARVMSVKTGASRYGAEATWQLATMEDLANGAGALTESMFGGKRVFGARTAPQAATAPDIVTTDAKEPEAKPAAVAAVDVAAAANSAAAKEIQGTWHIVSKIGPALCVGENDRNNSDPIVILNNYSAAATHTQWVLELKDDGSYIITNVKTQNVIDVPYSSKDNSVPLIQYSRHGGANQRWRVQTDRDGYVSFVSVESEKFIEIPNGVRVDNTQVIQYAYNNGDSQKFKLVPVGAAVCPTCGVSNAQSDAKEAKVSSKRARRIDVSSSFSYYFSYDGSVIFDSTAPPAAFIPTHLSNMSLSMGLNIYKGVGAYLDLGIKDRVAKKAINWAGRIGSKYFDLQLEYNFISGKVSYLENADFGADKDTPPDLKEDYDQTWVLVALMYPVPVKDFGTLLGVYCNYAKVPALVWVSRDKDDDESKFAVLDKDCPVTTYGLRFYWDNIGFKRIPDNLPRGWTKRFPLRFTGDMGFGFAKLNKEVIAAAKENGGQFSDDSYPTCYIGARIALGWEFFNRFTENQIVHLGLGFEFNGFGYAKPYSSWGSSDNWEASDNWSSIIVGGWGPIVRVGYAW